MTPSLRPLRLLPRRTPPLWQAALTTLVAFAGAVLIRTLLLGFDHAWGLSATYFPALILATLYAGPLWGWGLLVAVMLLGYFGNTAVAASMSRNAVMVQFAISGAATVWVAMALRGTFLRLLESEAAEAKALADLAATEARFRMLADSAPVLMWISKLDGGREFANRAYVDFVSDDYETALTYVWRDFIHPDDLDRIAEEERRTLAAGGDFIWEARYRGRDGDYPGWEWEQHGQHDRWHCHHQP